MNFKIFASKISGQFASESGGQFNRYMQFISVWGFETVSNEILLTKL